MRNTSARVGQDMVKAGNAKAKAQLAPKKPPLRVDAPSKGAPPSAKGETGRRSIMVVRPPEQPNGLPKAGPPTKGYSGLDHPPKGTHTAPISRLASVSAHPELAQHLSRPV